MATRYHIHKSRSSRATKPWTVAVDGADVRKTYTTWLEALQNVHKRLRIERIDEVLQDASAVRDEYHPLHLSVLKGRDRGEKAATLYMTALKRGMRVLTHLDECGDDMMMIRCIAGKYRKGPQPATVSV